MKKIFILTVMFFLSIFVGFATTHVITNVGFTFSPSTLTITSGDTVDFQLNSIHDVLEVSQTTWEANGNTPLVGGFSTGLGGGKVKVTDVGVHYYVCGVHFSFGMKGTITVIPAAGVSDISFNSGILLNISPNPVKGSFNIDYSINKMSKVEITLIDASGRIRDVYISDERFPGIYRDNIDRIYSPGLYFIRFTANNYTKTLKVIIL